MAGGIIDFWGDLEEEDELAITDPTPDPVAEAYNQSVENALAPVDNSGAGGYERAWDMIFSAPGKMADSWRMSSDEEDFVDAWSEVYDDMKAWGNISHLIDEEGKLKQEESSFFLGMGEKKPRNIRPESADGSTLGNREMKLYHELASGKTVSEVMDKSDAEIQKELDRVGQRVMNRELTPTQQAKYVQKLMKEGLSAEAAWDVLSSGEAWVALFADSFGPSALVGLYGLGGGIVGGTAGLLVGGGPNPAGIAAGAAGFKAGQAAATFVTSSNMEARRIFFEELRKEDVDLFSVASLREFIEGNPERMQEIIDYSNTKGMAIGMGDTLSVAWMGLPTARIFKKEIDALASGAELSSKASDRLARRGKTVGALAAETTMSASLASVASMTANLLVGEEIDDEEAFLEFAGEIAGDQLMKGSMAVPAEIYKQIYSSMSKKNKVATDTEEEVTAAIDEAMAALDKKEAETAAASAEAAAPEEGAGGMFTEDEQEPIKPNTPEEDALSLLETTYKEARAAEVAAEERRKKEEADALAEKQAKDNEGSPTPDTAKPDLDKAIDNTESKPTAEASSLEAVEKSLKKPADTTTTAAADTSSKIDSKVGENLDKLGVDTKPATEKVDAGTTPSQATVPTLQTVEQLDEAEGPAAKADLTAADGNTVEEIRATFDSYNKPSMIKAWAAAALGAENLEYDEAGNLMLDDREILSIYDAVSEALDNDGLEEFTSKGTQAMAGKQVGQLDAFIKAAKDGKKSERTPEQAAADEGSTEAAEVAANVKVVDDRKEQLKKFQANVDENTSGKKKQKGTSRAERKLKNEAVRTQVKELKNEKADKATDEQELLELIAKPFKPFINSAKRVTSRQLQLAKEAFAKLADRRMTERALKTLVPKINNRLRRYQSIRHQSDRYGNAPGAWKYQRIQAEDGFLEDGRILFSIRRVNEDGTVVKGSRGWTTWWALDISKESATYGQATLVDTSGNVGEKTLVLQESTLNRNNSGNGVGDLVLKATVAALEKDVGGLDGLLGVAMNEGKMTETQSRDEIIRARMMAARRARAALPAAIERLADNSRKLNAKLLELRRLIGERDNIPRGTHKQLVDNQEAFEKKTAEVVAAKAEAYKLLKKDRQHHRTLANLRSIAKSDDTIAYEVAEAQKNAIKTYQKYNGNPLVEITSMITLPGYDDGRGTQVWMDSESLKGIRGQTADQAIAIQFLPDGSTRVIELTAFKNGKAQNAYQAYVTGNDTNMGYESVEDSNGRVRRVPIKPIYLGNTKFGIDSDRKKLMEKMREKRKTAIEEQQEEYLAHDKKQGKSMLKRDPDAQLTMSEKETTEQKRITGGDRTDHTSDLTEGQSPLNLAFEFQRQINEIATKRKDMRIEMAEIQEELDEEGKLTGEKRVEAEDRLMALEDEMEQLAAERDDLQKRKDEVTGESSSSPKDNKRLVAPVRVRPDSKKRQILRRRLSLFKHSLSRTTDPAEQQRLREDIADTEERLAQTRMVPKKTRYIKQLEAEAKELKQLIKEAKAWNRENPDDKVPFAADERRLAKVQEFLKFEKELLAEPGDAKKREALASDYVSVEEAEELYYDEKKQWAEAEVKHREKMDAQRAKEERAARVDMGNQLLKKLTTKSRAGKAVTAKIEALQRLVYGDAERRRSGEEGAEVEFVHSTNAAVNQMRAAGNVNQVAEALGAEIGETETETIGNIKEAARAQLTELAPDTVAEEAPPKTTAQVIQKFAPPAPKVEGEAAVLEAIDRGLESKGVIEEARTPMIETPEGRAVLNVGYMMELVSALKDMGFGPKGIQDVVARVIREAFPDDTNPAMVEQADAIAYEFAGGQNAFDRALKEETLAREELANARRVRAERAAAIETVQYAVSESRDKSTRLGGIMQSIKDTAPEVRAAMLGKTALSLEEVQQFLRNVRGDRGTTPVVDEQERASLRAEIEALKARVDANEQRSSGTLTAPARQRVGELPGKQREGQSKYRVENTSTIEERADLAAQRASGVEGRRQRQESLKETRRRKRALNEHEAGMLKAAEEGVAFSNFGSMNKFFTKEKVKALEKKNKNKFNSGITPDDVRQLGALIGYFIEGGARSLAEVTQLVYNHLEKQYKGLGDKLSGLIPKMYEDLKLALYEARIMDEQSDPTLVDTAAAIDALETQGEAEPVSPEDLDRLDAPIKSAIALEVDKLAGREVPSRAPKGSRTKTGKEGIRKGLKRRLLRLFTDQDIEEFSLPVLRGKLNPFLTGWRTLASSTNTLYRDARKIRDAIESAQAEINSIVVAMKQFTPLYFDAMQKQGIEPGSKEHAALDYAVNLMLGGMFRSSAERKASKKFNKKTVVHDDIYELVRGFNKSKAELSMKLGESDVIAPKLKTSIRSNGEFYLHKSFADTPGFFRKVSKLVLGQPLDNVDSAVEELFKRHPELIRTVREHAKNAYGLPSNPEALKAMRTVDLRRMIGSTNALYTIPNKENKLEEVLLKKDSTEPQLDKYGEPKTHMVKLEDARRETLIDFILTHPINSAKLESYIDNVINGVFLPGTPGIAVMGDAERSAIRRRNLLLTDAQQIQKLIQLIKRSPEIPAATKKAFNKKVRGELMGLDREFFMEEMMKTDEEFLPQGVKDLLDRRNSEFAMQEVIRQGLDEVIAPTSQLVDTAGRIANLLYMTKAVQNLIEVGLSTGDLSVTNDIGTDYLLPPGDKTRAQLHTHELGMTHKRGKGSRAEPISALKDLVFMYKKPDGTEIKVPLFDDNGLPTVRGNKNTIDAIHYMLNVQNRSAPNALVNLMYGWSALAKYNAVVANPLAHPRNAVSSAMIGMSRGVLTGFGANVLVSAFSPAGAWSIGSAVAGMDFLGATGFAGTTLSAKAKLKWAQLDEAAQLMTKYGILHNGVRHGAMRDLLDAMQHLPNQELYGVLSGTTNIDSTTNRKLREAPEKTDKWLARMWTRAAGFADESFRLEDEAIKGIAWLQRTGQFISFLKPEGSTRRAGDIWRTYLNPNTRHLLTQAEQDVVERAMSLASSNVLDTFPTFSRVSEGIRVLSRFPLFGAFPSFNYEMIRNTKNHVLFTTGLSMFGRLPDGTRLTGRGRAKAAVLGTGLIAQGIAMGLVQVGAAGALSAVAMSRLGKGKRAIDEPPEADDLTAAYFQNLSDHMTAYNSYAFKNVLAGWYADSMIAVIPNSIDLENHSFKAWNLGWGVAEGAVVEAVHGLRNDIQKLRESGLSDEDTWLYTKELISDVADRILGIFGNDEVMIRELMKAYERDDRAVRFESQSTGAQLKKELNQWIRDRLGSHDDPLADNFGEQSSRGARLPAAALSALVGNVPPSNAVFSLIDGYKKVVTAADLSENPAEFFSEVGGAFVKKVGGIKEIDFKYEIDYPKKLMLQQIPELEKSIKKMHNLLFDPKRQMTQEQFEAYFATRAYFVKEALRDIHQGLYMGERLGMSMGMDKTDGVWKVWDEGTGGATTVGGYTFEHLTQNDPPGLRASLPTKRLYAKWQEAGGDEYGFTQRQAWFELAVAKYGNQTFEEEE